MAHNAVQGIQVTDVKVHTIKNRRPDSPLEAFARVVLNDQLVIQSIRVINGKKGFFISFPQEYNKQKQQNYDLCFPITRQLREYISEQVLDQYHNELLAPAA